MGCRRTVLYRLLAVCIGSSLALMTTFPGAGPGADDVYNFPHEDVIRNPVPRDLSRKHISTSEEAEQKKAPVHGLAANLPNEPGKPRARLAEKYRIPEELDESEIINPHPYVYIDEPKDDFCQGRPLAVIFLHSGRYARRENVRATWGNSSYHGNGKIRLVFVVASSVDPVSMKSIRLENQIYGDLLQENFIDNYKNLTIKVVGALRWIVTNCQQASFVVKTDDDAFVNIFSLIHHLEDLVRTKQHTNLFLCREMGHMPVLKKGKWAVKDEEYSENHYPPYCSGVAYIMSMDIAKKMYIATYKTRPFWVDDAWFTGVVAKTAGIEHTQAAKLYSFNKTLAESNFLGPNWYNYMFAHIGPKAMINIWKALVPLAANTTIPDSPQVIPGLVAPAG